MAARRPRDIGSDLEAIDGHLRGLAYQLRELGHPATPSDVSDEEGQARSWLWDLALETLERKGARLEELAVELYEFQNEQEGQAPSPPRLRAVPAAAPDGA